MNVEILKGFLIGCAFFGIGFVLGRLHRKIRRHKHFKSISDIEYYTKLKYEERLYNDYIKHKNSGKFTGSFEEYKERSKTCVFGTKGPS